MEFCTVGNILNPLIHGGLIYDDTGKGTDLLEEYLNKKSGPLDCYLNAVQNNF